MLEDDISLKEMIFLYKKTQPECKQYAAYEEKGLLWKTLSCEQALPLTGFKISALPKTLFSSHVKWR